VCLKLTYTSSAKDGLTHVDSLWVQRTYTIRLPTVGSVSLHCRSFGIA